MARIDLNVEQIEKLNSDILSERQEINKYLESISTYCDDLHKLIGGDISNLISSFNRDIDSINKNMATEFEELVNFLKKQLTQYSGSYSDASSSLKSILDSIANSKFN